jgi:hypothetical protein
MARYLFICGGTGKQIVMDRSLLNFDGFVQIDVSAEVVKPEQIADPLRTKVLPLPVKNDAIVDIKSALESMRKELIEKYNNKLVAKNDVAKSNHVSRYTTLREPLIKEFAEYEKSIVELSYSSSSNKNEEIKRLEFVVAFRDAHPEFVKLLDNASVKEYRSLVRECNDLKNSVKVITNALNDQAQGSGLLSYGMAQRPLVGSAYFGRQLPKNAFVNIIEELLKNSVVPASETIELWIVSSMCGGTGQGISYHVADYLVEIFKSKLYSKVMVNFVRLGAETYASYGYGNSIANNCAMATIHDAALAYGVKPERDVSTLIDGLKKKFPEKYAYDSEEDSEALDLLPTEVAPQQDGVQYNFYYLELHDYVGIFQSGITDEELNKLREQASLKRGEALASAMRAIVNRELQTKFQVAFINVKPSWHRALYVRSGMWENGIDTDSLYGQTAAQLLEKIEAEYTKPNYINLADTMNHRWVRNGGLDSMLVTASDLQEELPPDDVSKKLKPKSLKLSPAATKVRKVSSSEQDLNDFISSDVWESANREMVRVLNGYLGANILNTYAVTFELAEKRGVDDIVGWKPVSFPVNIPSDTSADYITELRKAHLAIAKIDSILSSNSTSVNGSLAQLYDRWNVLVPSAFESKDAYARRLRTGIKPYIESWCYVSTLLELRKAAKSRIESAVTWLSPLVTQLSTENNRRVRLTSIQPLDSASINGHTWLSVCVDHARKYQEASTPPSRERARKSFEAIVVQGSQGLTFDGLKTVLGLASNATVQDIVDEISIHCGRIPEGIWWQRQNIGILENDNASFKYVIFPFVDEVMWDEILKAAPSNGATKPNIIRAEDKYTGLKVLALQCARNGDWFPRASGLAASEFNGTLLSTLKQEAGENNAGHMGRVAYSSTAHPVYVTDIVMKQTDNSLSIASLPVRTMDRL